VCDNKRVTPSMILSMAMKKDESLFKSWTAQRVSSRLRNYGIPTPKKSNGRRVYRVNRDVLRKIQDNYGIELEIPVPIPTPRSRP
jgi:membrane-bound lytic murein transglycosylase B